MPDGVAAGLVSVQPDRIQAFDTDSYNAPIRYSFQDGSPGNFRDFFEIHPNSGLVRQIRPVRRSDTAQFNIVVKVMEMSLLTRGPHTLL